MEKEFINKCELHCNHLHIHISILLTCNFFLHWPTVSLEYTGNFTSDMVDDILNLRNISVPPSTGSENSAGESRPFSSLTILIGYDRQYMGTLYCVPNSS